CGSTARCSASIRPTRSNRCPSPAAPDAAATRLLVGWVGEVGAATEVVRLGCGQVTPGRALPDGGAAHRPLRQTRLERSPAQRPRAEFECLVTRAGGEHDRDPVRL